MRDKERVSMKIDVGLNHILEKIIPIDVDSIFPEEISQDVCYTEMGKQLLLEEIKEIRENLGWQLFYFLEMMGAGEPRKEEEDLSPDRLSQLIRGISADPFAEVKPHFSPEFQKLIDNAKRYHQSTYRLVVKILTELAWKHEVLGDNVLFLKNRLAETCSKLYLDLKSKEMVAKVDSKGKIISELTKDRKRRDAVMFGYSPGPTRITLDVGEYADLGAAILMEALNLNFSVHHIALVRKDNIQAFRSFRKAVRIRKRFGLTKTMRNYLMDRDLFMTHNSLMQMGQKEDDLELRKFEVQKRTEQQIRNLKYKVILID
jgi:hypothetical protein